jgi:hypothetical protein
MISSANAVIIALTINRKMLGNEPDQYLPFMHDDETKWLLKYWLLTCCFQVQAVNPKNDPYGLSIQYNQSSAEALGVTLDSNTFTFLPSTYGGRLAAVWLKKLTVDNKDDPDSLLCEYAQRCFEAAVGNTQDHQTFRRVWLNRLMMMIDAHALKE